MGKSHRGGQHPILHPVRGVNDRNVPDKQVRALKIKSIPRNFLLDKERRIIAKDLRGEELLNA